MKRLPILSQLGCFFKENSLSIFLSSSIFSKFVEKKNVKKILFFTTSSFYPDEAGGAQHSALTLFLELKKLGWEIYIMCRQARTKEALLVGEESKNQFYIDFTNGFKCVRYSRNISKLDLQNLFRRQLQILEVSHVLGEVFSTNIEDLFSVLNYSAWLNLKTLCFVRTIEGIRSKKDTLKISNRIKFISNSQFTHDEILKNFNIKTEIILPFIYFKKIKALQNKKKYVTFINPVEVKGVKTAIEVAEKLPEISFLFVMGGWTKENYLDTNQFLLKLKTIKNITILGYQEDPREIYSKTKILLVPSHFEETFGRVILEAQFNGIPVIGSNRGNIPNTLGKGGYVIDDYKNPEAYIEKLRLLLNDQELYQKHSEEARKQSNKEEFSLEKQVRNFVSIIEGGRN